MEEDAKQAASLIEQKSEKKEKEEKQIASAEWCDDEIKLLVKGVKIIPVGTRDR